MDHVAIVSKSWKVVEAILSGQKSIESRWLVHKTIPWDRINTGDIVYFKETGGLVRAKADVVKVEQIENLTPKKINQLIEKYNKLGLGTENIIEEIKTYCKGKNYAIFIHLQNPKAIQKPFKIDKTGYGNMSAWMRVGDIRNVVVE